LSNPHSGEIRIGCPDGIGAVLLPIVNKFSQQYPNVVFDVHEEEVESLSSKLRERSLDFVIQRLRSFPLAESSVDDLDVELLFEDELVVVAGGPSPWVRRRKIDLAQLVDEPWILSGPPSWNHRIVTEAFTSRGLPMPKVVVKTFSVQIRANMVSSGRFIATFPKSMVRFYADRFSLKILPVDLPIRPWPVAFLTIKNRTLSSVVTTFIGHLREFGRTIQAR
jgi:DNA-binding transcriptional LysR family regulator